MTTRVDTLKIIRVAQGITRHFMAAKEDGTVALGACLYLYVSAALGKGYRRETIHAAVDEIIDMVERLNGKKAS